jgi:hypothetical protein
MYPDLPKMIHSANLISDSSTGSVGDEHTALLGDSRREEAISNNSNAYITTTRSRPLRAPDITTLHQYRNISTSGFPAVTNPPVAAMVSAVEPLQSASVSEHLQSNENTLISELMDENARLVADNQSLQLQLRELQHVQPSQQVICLTLIA